MSSWTNSGKGKIDFPGLIEVERVDDNVVALVVRGTNGPVRIGHRDYGGLQFFHPTPPKTTNAYKVHGTIKGVRVEDMYFEDQYLAKRKAEDNDLECTEVKCLVNDDGTLGKESL